MGPSSVSLDVPCRPEYIALGRLVAGSLGLQQGWDEEAITDLKMVVSEMSSLFISPPDPPDPGALAEKASSQTSILRLGFDVKPDEWTLTVCNPDLGLRLSQDACSDPLSERALGLTIVRALVDTVEQSDDQTRGTVFRLSKHLSLFQDSED